MAAAPIPAWAQSAWMLFTDRVGSKPFRRQQLADFLNEQRRPRNYALAVPLAEKLIQRAIKTGVLSKAGHVHWALGRNSTRKLASGREVTELAGESTLTVHTHAPAKYVLVDLETGDVWSGSPKGWERCDLREVERDGPSVRIRLAPKPEQPMMRAPKRRIASLGA